MNNDFTVLEGCIWWDSNLNKKSICWISWDRLAKSKSEDGLGFREIQNFNDALLAKLSWRILSKPNSLVARVLLGKYCKDKTLLKVESHSSSSHGCREILTGRNLLVKQLGVAIGNGENTSVGCRWKHL